MEKWGPHTPYFIVVVVALALPTLISICVLNLFDTLAFRCIPMAMTHHGQGSSYCTDVRTVICE